jgi:hypothetical protein
LVQNFEFFFQNWNQGKTVIRTRTRTGKRTKTGLRIKTGPGLSGFRSRKKKILKELNLNLFLKKILLGV